MVGNASSCAIEPAALCERDAARFLSISPRLLRQLVGRGDLNPVRVPGVRRVLFDVAELRRVFESWKGRSTEGASL